MAVNETIKNGFYRVYDPLNAIWRRIALWTKGEQVECADGNTVEEKIGAINGITDSLASNASDIAASAAAVNTLNQNLANVNVYVGDDEKLHFVNSGGADSVLPFSNGVGFTLVKFSFLNGQPGVSGGIMYMTFKLDDTSKNGIVFTGSVPRGLGAKSNCKVSGLKVTVTNKSKNFEVRTDLESMQWVEIDSIATW